MSNTYILNTSFTYRRSNLYLKHQIVRRCEHEIVEDFISCVRHSITSIAGYRRRLAGFGALFNHPYILSHDITL